MDDVIKMYILRNFLRVTNESDQFLQIPYDGFYEIVSDNRLNVKTEEPVWECCLKWIDYDCNNRKQFVYELLAAIRLGLMPLEVCV